MLFLIRFSIYYIFSFVGFAMLAFVPTWVFNRFVLGTLDRWFSLRMLTSTELVWTTVFIGVVGTLYMLIAESLTNTFFDTSLGDARQINEHDEEYADLHRIFRGVRSRFKNKNAGLYVLESDESNAYAIQSPTRKAVAFTTPLLEQMHALWKPDQTDEQRQQYEAAIEGIIAHEFSHLKHNDFVPSWFFYGTIRVADFIRKTLVRIIQGIVFVVAFIPFIGPLGAYALGLVTQVVHGVTLGLFKMIIPRFIRFFDALPMRIVENRCDRHAVSVVGATPVFLGLYTLADQGHADRLRLLDDHPPTIVRVARVYSLMTRRDEGTGRVIHSVSALNSAVAVIAVVLFIAISGITSFVAADHLGWTTDAEEDYPTVQAILTTSRTVTETSTDLLETTWRTMRPITAGFAQPLRPAYELLISAGDRLAAISNGSETVPSRESFIVHRIFVAFVALVLFLLIGVRILDFLLAIALLPVRLLLKLRENTRDTTDLDFLFYRAVEANSLIGVLSLLWHGGNKDGYPDEHGTPLQYALKNRRYRIAIHLAV